MPLYKAMKVSKMYPYATINPVASMIFAEFCRWRIGDHVFQVVVAARIGIASTSTMAKPE